MLQKLYSKDHEWVIVDKDNKVATMGISSYAKHNLGDIVFVELPQVGTSLNCGEGIAVVESAKVASDIYAPIGGEVIEINTQLEKNPEQINSEDQMKDWICKLLIKSTNELESLMSEERYLEFIAEKQYP